MPKRSTLLKWRDALDLKIRTEYRAPVISNYQLAVELVKLMSAGTYVGRSLRMPARPVDRPLFYKARAALVESGLLVPSRTLPNTILRFPDRKDSDPAEVHCTIDPFGHVAYLSAMAFHGLTNRLPRVLYYVTPDASTWSRLASERMDKDLGELRDAFVTAQLPELRHTVVKRMNGMVIETFRSKDAGGWIHAREGALRVASLGRTFLQMLQRSDLCGGIRHVIEVYEEHARLSLKLIVSELSQRGTKIDRVRAGYILEELCGLKDPGIDEWTKDASRGGSRRLDPQAPYAPKFSERWCLSINV
jgi:hypothetical protein